MARKLSPMHPGEVLREEFLEPLGLSCGVPRTRVERIAAEKMGISGDTAIRLAAFFGTTPEFWMNLQSRYELLTAEAAIATATIPRFKPPIAA